VTVIPGVRHALARTPAALLVLLVLSAALSGCRSATPTPEQSLARGVEYLLDTQNSDGSWGTFDSARPYEIYLANYSSFRAFHQATSALCCEALIDASRSDPRAMTALRRGVEFLLTDTPAGRASGDTFYDVWTHTYAIQLFAALLADDRFADLETRLRPAAQDAIARLCQRQTANGGWGYYDFNFIVDHPSGEESTSFNTADALLVLEDARRVGLSVPESVIADGLACLNRLRLPSGAYVYGIYAEMAPQAGFNLVKGSLGRSQSCNLALYLHQQQMGQPDLKLGLENLINHHLFIQIGQGRPYPHEAWYYTAGYYYLHGHYYASRVINTLTPDADSARYRAWLAGNMADVQNRADGSWLDFPLYGFGKAYGTAYGVMTLQNCLYGAAVRPADRLALRTHPTTTDASAHLALAPSAAAPAH